MCARQTPPMQRKTITSKRNTDNFIPGFLLKHVYIVFINHGVQPSGIRLLKQFDVGFLKLVFELLMSDRPQGSLAGLVAFPSLKYQRR